MATIGIDVGKRQHVAAIHRDGESQARRAVLRFGADRRGLVDLSAWLAVRSPARSSSPAASTT